ncbi:MAG: aldose epimerase family protein [Bacteroidota bacterium]|nr:aldose epimerase family protein [Bacteroidota bacterium]
METNQPEILTLKNAMGSFLSILNFGASLFSFKIKNNKGELIDVVVGPADPEVYTTAQYREENKCFGGSIGRFAGRISEGQFSIGEEKYSVYEEYEGAHLHGGKKGFQYRFWNIDSVSEGENPQAVLSYHSEHLEEGYPGNLKVQVTYQLTEDNQVKITYRAETDRDTIVNLTNHTYFNLNGSGSVSDHFMQVNASKILELDERNLPTGNLTKLKGHPKDHRESKLLGNRELDDVYVLDTMENETQVQLFSPLSGIKLKLKSNQPVVVIYSPESLPDKWQYLAQIDEKFPAVALEAQNYPDAPNFRNFPSSLLKKGEVYENEIVYSFSVK